MKKLHNKRYGPKLIVLTVLIITVLCCSIGVFANASKNSSSDNTGSHDLSTLRGIFLYSQNNTDYPSKQDMSNKELVSEATDIVNFARQNGYNALFFQASPGSDAMYRSDVFPASHYWTGEQGKSSFSEPLKILISIAKENGVEVYAVVNPYNVGPSDLAMSKDNPAVQHPDWTLSSDNRLYYNPASSDVQALVQKSINELAKMKDLSGVLLQDIDNSFLSAQSGYYDNTLDLIQKCHTQINEYNPDFEIGLMMQSNSLDSSAASSFVSSVVSQNLADFFVPRMVVPTSQSGTNYEGYLSKWKQQLTQNGNTVQMIPSNLAYRVKAPTTDGFYFSDPYEVNYQIIFNHTYGINSNIVESYSSLKFNVYPIAQDLLNLYNSDTTMPKGINLSIPQSFQITRPRGTITTNYATYFITGLSNPSLPVLLDGKELPNRTSYGGFGVLVNVAVGSNSYTISQGNKSYTVNINRPDPSATKSAVPISQIVKGTTYPKYDLAVENGKEMTLQCTAPSGGKVTATLNGKSYDLKQAAATASNGVPAVYTTKIALSEDSLPQNETTSIGAVTYTLTYNGIVTNLKSAGDVFAVGNDANLVVETTKFLGNVLKDPAKDGDFLTTLKQGAKDFVSSSTDNYYILGSGGYISKGEVSILTGNASATNRVTNVILETAAKGEKLTILGSNRSPFHASMNKERTQLTVKVFNLQDMPSSLAHLKSSIFKNISVTVNQDQSATIVFDMNDNLLLWGYNITYEDNNLVIYCKTPPTISKNYEKPLEGISIVIDPGHGGTDVGALGVGGVVGPMEKDINFAAAYTTAQRLKSLGASVHMTRSDDSNVALDDRLLYTQQNDADFFLSFHHNSTAESRNSYETAGLEIYYHETISKPFADTLMKKLSTALSRNNRGTHASYYRVTRVTYAPAVLLELGYLPNPNEYQNICNSFSIYKTACAVSSSIIDSLR